MKFLQIVVGVISALNQTEQIMTELENRVLQNQKKYIQVLTEKLSKTFTKFEEVAEKVTAQKNMALQKELLSTLHDLQSISKDVKKFDL